MIGFDYGNARVRAMRSNLLGMSDYAALVTVGSFDAFLGAFHTTPYQSDIETAMTRERGLRAVDEAIRRNLARTLRAMRSFYADEAGRLVELLVRRWDIRNLRSLLRVHARLRPPESVVPELVAAGLLTEAELSQLAAAPGLRALVDLMVAWELPDRSAARRILRQLPAFDTTGDVATLERTLIHAWGEGLTEQLTGLPDDDGLVLILRSELDLSNVLAAVRYWEASDSGESVPPDLIDELTPGGLVSIGALAAAGHHRERAEVAQTLVGAPGLPGWDTALDRWAEHGDATVLAEELSRTLTRTAVGLFTRDPLDSSIPTAFTFAKEAEAQNVRLVARGVIHGFHPDEIIEHLVAA